MLREKRGVPRVTELIVHDCADGSIRIFLLVQHKYLCMLEG